MADRVDPAARVYADALHQAAEDAGKVQEVDRDLAGFMDALGENPAVLRAASSASRNRIPNRA